MLMNHMFCFLFLNWRLRLWFDGSTLPLQHRDFLKLFSKVWEPLLIPPLTIWGPIGTNARPLSKGRPSLSTNTALLCPLRPSFPSCTAPGGPLFKAGAQSMVLPTGLLNHGTCKRTRLGGKAAGQVNPEHSGKLNWLTVTPTVHIILHIVLVFSPRSRLRGGRTS